MHRVTGLAVVIAIGVGACGAGDPAASASIPSSEPVQGAAQDGEWRLIVSAPRSVWPAGAPIDVTAELQWIGAGEGTTYYAAGAGPLVFSLAEHSGRRRLDGIRTGDCVVHEIRGNEPFVTELVKSGGFDAADPNAAFYRAFFEDPELRLPTGRWEIRAEVELYMPPAWCSGRLVRMEAAIVLDVR